MHFHLKQKYLLVLSAVIYIMLSVDSFDENYNFKIDCLPIKFLCYDSEYVSKVTFLILVKSSCCTFGDFYCIL